ncbi:MAG: VanZ family protein [Fibrobacterota bacterium]|nr:VanZ family protein [Fibrobacterota bacterium]QQS07166.1 MAG: VanZ family protein [Fibrobacterota bacterium]
MQIALTMKEQIETWFWRAVALGGATMQLWGSSKTGDEVSITAPWDKVVHGAAFGVLAYVCCLGAGRWKDKAFWMVPLGIALFAGTDEWHQSFIAGRSASWDDLAVDLVGCALAVLGWSRARAQERIRSHP